MKYMYTTIFLYGVLGFVLGLADITILDDTYEFLSIMLLVLAIDIISYKHGKSLR